MSMDDPKTCTNRPAGIASVLCAQAMRTLEAARKHLSENSAVGALERGKVFSIAAEYEQAANSFLEAVAQDPNLLEAAARLPLSLLKARKPEKALEHAMELASRQPKFMVQELMSEESVSAMTILGETLLANGRIPDAIEAYTKAREISQKDSYAAGRLAQLHLATGRAQEAVELSGTFSSNPRFCFRNLEAVLPLGKTHVGLLPVITAENLVANVATCMPGRPILADGTPRVAPLVWGDDRWCAECTEDVTP